MSLFNSRHASLAQPVKKLIAACALVSGTCNACVLNIVEVQQVRDVMEANGGYAVPDQQCKLLQSKGLVLHVMGYGKGLGNTSVAWAEVRLQDPILGVISNQAGISTFANSANATDELANNLLYRSIKDAMSRLDFEVAANEIDAFKAKARELNSRSVGKPGP
ncbi:uncharacterized protein YsxB (DUF464 family) [Duganella sp. 1224]|uniref:hypothetical protein n=1 Tax=Duganella sp. 1224 TaxID=2587052 RepID=UPI0015CDFA26|nr:hypothetical protein [Duganella sp. 1224]NYE62467.1 uncharacterized protein YsxB (DUF464 family) [Duganella sp. 1224]